MERRRIVRKALWVSGSLLAVIATVLAAWAAVVGPVTALRVLRFGDTDIFDFTHYPVREMQPGTAVSALIGSDSTLEFSASVIGEEAGQSSLESLLPTNDTIAFIVLQGGRIVYEKYFARHAPDALSQLFSVSKSVTSALIGAAIDDGLLAGTEQSVVDHVPELAPRGFDGVTLHHLLNMTSGSSYVESDNPFGAHVTFNYTPALEREILGLRTERRAGELFRYKSGDNALAALVLRRALGSESIAHYMERRLWQPLGMESRALWIVDREDGMERTWCCLATSARDLARFGQLYLNQGEWYGRRVLSAEWIAVSTAPQVPAALWPQGYADIGWRGYGYYWWLASAKDRDYFAFGKDGQFLYVNPARRTVIVRLGRSVGTLRPSQWVRVFQSIAGQADARPGTAPR